MNLKRRKEIFQKIMNECMELSEKKGKDYSGDYDSLSNFKLNAESLNITKYQTWAIYFKKGIDAILNSIKANPGSPQVESEPLRERIKDGIIYLVLLLCLLTEDEEAYLGSSTDRTLKEFEDYKFKGPSKALNDEELVEQILAFEYKGKLFDYNKGTPYLASDIVSDEEFLDPQENCSDTCGGCCCNKFVNCTCRGQEGKTEFPMIEGHSQEYHVCTKCEKPFF